MRFYEIIAESDSDSHGYWVTTTGEIIECNYATNTHHIDIAKKHFPNSGQPGAYEAGWVRYSQSRMSVAINYHKDVAPPSSLRKVARSLARVADDFTFHGHHKPMEVYIEYARREWSKFDKKAALGRLMADAGAVLAEAPLGNYELHGDWENDRHVPVAVIDGGGPITDPKSTPGDERSIDPKGNSFASRIDRALVRDPRTEDALRRSLAHLPLTFHLLFLNGAEGIRIAQGFLDSGNYTPGNEIDDALGTDMIKRIASLRKEDPKSVIILLTHNEGGTVRHPLTPWMIVHRLAHASQYTFRHGRYSPSHPHNSIEKCIRHVASCYDVQSVQTDTTDEQVLLQLCTFRSARENMVNQTVGLETGCELLTQYMMTGTTKMRAPDALMMGPHKCPLKRGPLYRQQAAAFALDLQNALNDHIAAYLAEMEGETYIC